MDHNYTDTPVFDSSTPLRFNPRQPPQPNPNNPLVLRFTAAKEAIANANVINHEGSVRYSFTSESEGQMQMHDQVGNKIARVEGGQIFFRNSEGQKLKTFLRKMPSNTFSVITLDEQLYEWVQEIFYAVVRTTPQSARRAIIFNFSGNPAVEMLPEGAAVNDLEEFIVLTAAIIETGILKKKGKTK
ncbi:hypothetical protein PNOK_0401000 [Pyrrhoderma noxium]|uniref:Uncharacterized protein n=1 Tax=Pyrrhoderma noxium TaxID=2282107 RepID=A0A286UP66_9AGAM|nr:hypothetical protein PNOK_0401000 [Pyrrhoderma noxium]